MLFIHGSLSMGGVETFFLRMAKQRALENKHTVIILLSSAGKSDSGLIDEAKRYATVLFLPDLTYLPNVLAKHFPFHLSLLLPLKSDFKRHLKNIEQAHVSCGICAFFYVYISRLLPVNIKLTIGLYHSLEFSWRKGKLPYFEQQNRELFFNKIDKKNIIFFNESMVPFYESFSGQSFQEVNLFPLGVVEQVSSKALTHLRQENTILRLVSVGRLVSFKTYNLHMIDVVNELIKRNIKVIYDIYGDGLLEQEIQCKIDKYGLSKYVKLKGRLDYSQFAEVVSSYDIFIGSGTAIIESSSLGVSSIVGIENSLSADTYGFLTDIPGFSYNEDGLYPKSPILDVVLKFISLTPCEILELRNEHITKSKLFSIQSCVSNFENINSQNTDSKELMEYSSLIFRFKYAMSLFFTSLILRIKGTSLSDFTRQ